MKTKHLSMRWRPLALLLICAIGSSASAQSLNSSQKTVTVSEQFVIEAEKATAERDHLRRVVALKDQQLAAKDEEVKALHALVDIERLRAKAWAEAATERKEALSIDDKRFAAFEQELLRVRAERDSAKKAQKAWGFGGLVFGLALGYLSQRQK